MKKYLVLLFFTKVSSILISQVYFNETFGSGSANFAPSNPNVMNMTYTSALPFGLAQYTICHGTEPASGWAGSYVTSLDHTTDVNGYNLLINSPIAGQVIYRKLVTGITTNQSMIARCYGLNATIAPLATIQIRVKNSLGTIIFSSPNTTLLNTNNWISCSVSFNSGLNTSLTLEVVSNTNSGTGNGNDFALDDISLIGLNPLGNNLIYSESYCESDKTVFEWKTTDTEIDYNYLIKAFDKKGDFKYEFLIPKIELNNINTYKINIEPDVFFVKLYKSNSGLSLIDEIALTQMKNCQNSLDINYNNGFLNIDFVDSPKEVIKVQIIDSKGKIVRFFDQKSENQDSIKLELSDLSSGIYNVFLQIGEDIYRKKIFIN